MIRFLKSTSRSLKVHGVRLMTLLLLSLKAMAASPDQGADTEAMDVGTWEALWTRVLARHVDDAGRIDFAGLEQDHRDLDRVVAFIAATDPATRPQLFRDRESKLAFYINAYNALAMHGVVEDGIPKTLGGFKKVRFFYLKKFIVGNKSISLYHLENEVIRPLGEERIHFALNCMVVGCPRLPRVAFSAEVLDRQLEMAARTFVEENRNVRVDPAKREVWLSAIFDFYTEDFLAHAPSLIVYVNRYRDEPVPGDFRLRFRDYDWTVNRRAPRADSA